MIRWLHIILTVYIKYPTLAFLVWKHLGIDALLELEMTNVLFSFKAQFPKMQYMYQSFSRFWVRICTKQIILLFVKGTFNQKNQLPFSLLTIEETVVM